MPFSTYLRLVFLKMPACREATVYLFETGVRTQILAQYQA